jgi:hypothetical protein
MTTTTALIIDGLLMAAIVVVIVGGLLWAIATQHRDHVVLAAGPVLRRRALVALGAGLRPAT